MEIRDKSILEKNCPHECCDQLKSIKCQTRMLNNIRQIFVNTFFETIFTQSFQHYRYKIFEAATRIRRAEHSAFLIQSQRSFLSMRKNFKLYFQKMNVSFHVHILLLVFEATSTLQFRRSHCPYKQIRNCSLKLFLFILLLH